MSDTAQGYGEGIHGLGAAATLIRGDQDVVVGPLVAFYIHPAKTQAQLKFISENVEMAAHKISQWRCHTVDVTANCTNNWHQWMKPSTA
jgi:hypothetical protein